MTRYTSVTEADLVEMLGTIGVDSIDELFAAIPAGVRLNRSLSLPDGLSEHLDQVGLGDGGVAGHLLVQAALVLGRVH